MTVLWVILAVVGACYVLSRLTAAPGARGVPVAARLAEARRIVTSDDDRPVRVLQLVSPATRR